MNRHKNIWTLFGTFSCQILYHGNWPSLVPPPADASAIRPASLSRLCTATLYADLTENRPFESKCQAGQSGMSSPIGIVKIASASSSQKVSRTNCSSQPPKIGSISSSTLVSKEVPLGVAGRRVSPHGIHGSDHILICFPSPTRQIRPFFSNSTPCKMLHQVYEIPPLAWHSRMLL